MKLEWNTKFICKLTDRQGFTLLEVLISLFLLVVALFAIMATTNVIIKENGMNKMRTTATTLAKDKMEFLKNQSYVNYTNLIAGTYTDYATIDSTIQASATGAFYMRTWTIIYYTSAWIITNDPLQTAMKTINVTVSWSWMGQNKTVSLNSIVSQ